MSNLTKISTAAFYSGKATKEAAFAAVKSLCDSPLAETHADELAKLYSYFCPSPPKLPKSPEQWVALAADPQDYRRYLRLVYVSNRTAHASDGRRMHIAPTTLADGWYDLALSPIVVPSDYAFPDVARVMPAHKNHEPAPMQPDIIPTGMRDYVCVRGIYLQSRYYMDAISIMTAPQVFYGTKDEAIKLVDGDKIAIIMPYRL